MTFSILPLDRQRTLVRTTWLVHADAEEGQDYDLDNLTRVWQATNEQDASLSGRPRSGSRARNTSRDRWRAPSSWAATSIAGTSKRMRRRSERCQPERVWFRVDRRVASLGHMHSDDRSPSQHATCSAITTLVRYYAGQYLHTCPHDGRCRRNPRIDGYRTTDQPVGSRHCRQIVHESRLCCGGPIACPMGGHIGAGA